MSEYTTAPVKIGIQILIWRRYQTIAAIIRVAKAGFAMLRNAA
jgi:hypothetical protein